MRFFGPNLPKKGSCLNFAYSSSSLYQISLWIISNFWNKVAQERYLWSKTEKVNIIIEFRIFKLVLVPNFSLNWQFWFFWPDLPKKGFSGLKQKKWTPHIFYIILHIQISLVRNFSSNWQFWFFGPNLPKKVFPVKNRKSEHHHGILHIWISLDTKFQLKLIILSFWTKFTQKRYFQSKTEQAIQELHVSAFWIVNVNSTVVSEHFERKIGYTLPPGLFLS